MSEGLKTLLEAAQYIEQQEKLKLSPLATAIPAILSDHHPPQRFIAHYGATATTTALNGLLSSSSLSTTNNNNSINIRNSNIRHGGGSGSISGTLQVSSSAPAAAATFQHVNGHHSSSATHPHVTATVLTNGTNSATTNGHHHPPQQQQQQHNSQLIHANHHDYEFNGNSGVAGVTTTSSVATGLTNGISVTTSSSASVAAAAAASLLSSASLSDRPSESRIAADDSNNLASSSASPSCTTNTTNTTTSFMLVSNSGNLSQSSAMATIATSDNSSVGGCDAGGVTSKAQQQPQHEKDDTFKQQRQSQSQQHHTSPQKSSLATTTFTLIDSNGEIIGNATTSAASKQMLLANGIRIASPIGSALGGGLQQTQVLGSSSKAISIPLNDKNIPIITPGLPYLPQQHTNNVGGLSRHKQFIPLTPPPMASRKFVEPSQSRIRSFSMSSHKFSANHQMHVQNSNGNSSSSTTSSSMMVDDIPPTQQHSTGYATASGISNGQQHSPPRQSGNHYMHMISQQAGAAAGNPHVAHVTPRRRTISSTSNGAGTREVHNKLEKNRRAHLKECYEALKNQLSLKDEDRRKTSNLAILGEALKCVQTYQKCNQELEAEWEHLANEKINLQKRIVSLKRDLGPKYEQTFLGIFPDIEIGSIPSERDTINDTHSLSSGRGSTLYSSSSSLSSGGSNGSNSNGSSNAMSSPVGAGLQTAMPTAISPVINKISNNNTTNISNSSTSPIAINSNNIVMQQQQQQLQLQHQRKHPTTTITTTIQAVTIPTQVTGTGGLATSAPILGGGNNSPTAVSPTTMVTFGGSVASSMPLSLTAKNISATAITRGSPTPSTPSPSPSSSSGVSSSSSLISSSPPINGVINNGRNVTVNIPNGLKLQAANANGVTVGIGGGTLSAAHTLTGTIGNGVASAAATIIATSAPAQGATNTNNAALLAGNHMTQSPHQQQQQQQYNGRKKGLNSSSHNNHVVVENVLSSKNHHQFLLQQPQISHEDGEQPAKFLKVFNATATTLNGGVVGGLQECLSNGGQKIILTNNNIKNGEEAPGVGISISNSNLTQTNGKSLSNGCSPNVGSNELCRLPGGAELNILPTISSITNGINSSNINTYSTITTTTTTANGLKSDNSPASTMATAFYHANGKITFVSGPAPSPITNAVSNGTRVTAAANGIMLKDVTSSVAPLLVSATGSPIATCTSTSSSSVNSINTINDLHFTGNFAQLLAAANGNCNAVTTHPSSSSHSTGVTSNGYAAAMSNGSVNVTSLSSLTSNLPHVTTTAVDMAKIKTNSKSSSIVAWRSGATTTIN